MRSKHRIVNVKSAALSGCVCAISIPGGGDSRLFPKIGFEGFLLQGCCKYGFDTVEGIQRFRFKNKAGGSCEIKPICT